MDPRWCQDGPKIGQGSPKTAQDAPKMAQDGPKMGADRGPRSTPDRSFASDLLADSWGPVLGTILDGFGDHFGTILGAFWDNLGTILGPFKDRKTSSKLPKISQKNGGKKIMIIIIITIFGTFFEFQTKERQGQNQVGIQTASSFPFSSKLGCTRPPGGQN